MLVRAETYFSVVFFPSGFRTDGLAVHHAIPCFFKGIRITMMTNAVDYRPLTTQNAINIMVNLYCTMFVLLTIFHVPYVSFFIETNRRFATSQLNFGSLKSENWKILQEIRVYSLEKTNCDIWTGVLFQTAQSIEYAALCTETYDMDIFRLIVIFFSFNFKGKRRRKKTRAAEI